MKCCLIVYAALEVVLIALLVMFLLCNYASWAFYALWGAVGLSAVMGVALFVATFGKSKKQL